MEDTAENMTMKAASIYSVQFDTRYFICFNICVVHSSICNVYIAYSHLNLADLVLRVPFY